MKVSVDMGQAAGGEPALLDLEELLATRLLVQGNSGSGKSHLLRRLLERSAEWVQQAIVDPEGDFVTLADRFGHIVVDAASYAESDVARVAARVREHRVSVVLNLEGLDVDAQMRCAAAFLNGLFDAERDHWYPMLVVVDEAQLFAPAVGGEVADDARKASLGAMTNLMCRGRKRGLAGVIATQRLAKLAKNVAAEASNFLMGRTFLDIDMARAADLLGMERRQAEMFRDLERGRFIALGPALSRRPLTVAVGEVETSARSGSPKLVAPPPTLDADAKELLLKPAAPEPRRFVPPPPPPPPPPPLVEDLLHTVEQRPAPLAAEAEPSAPAMSADERAGIEDEILADMLADPDAAFRQIAVLYQDFLVRCRIRRLQGLPLDLNGFRRRLTIARAGVGADAAEDADWGHATAIAAGLPEDVQGVYLLLARAALNGEPCPSDEAVARVCGSQSPGRARRLLAYMEGQGALVVRKDLRGRRIIALPDLGRETAAEAPDVAA
jgi:hypothetical protein